MDFLIRTAFLSIFSFELLNVLKIIHFPLHYSWIILASLSLGFWLFWEKISRKKLELPRLTGFILLIQIYANSLGSAFGFYNKFLWYDRLTHFTGGATGGTVMFLLLRYLTQKYQWNLKTLALSIFAISLALSIGIFYEIFELFMQTTFGYQMIWDIKDTADDLFYDLIGTVIAVLSVNFIWKNFHPPSLIDSKTK